MDIADITAHSELIPISDDHIHTNVYRTAYRFVPKQDTVYTDSNKRIFTALPLESLIEKTIVSEEEQKYCRTHDFFFYGTGWQSWGFGGEIEPGKHGQRFIPLVPQFKKYISMPGGKPLAFFKTKEKLLVGQFICYFRWNNIYLVVASTGNCHLVHTLKAASDEVKKTNTSVKNTFASLVSKYEAIAANATSRVLSDALVLPPVEYTIDRRNRILTGSVDAKGKVWNKNELVAELSVFCVHGFFELREIIQRLYGTTSEKRFSQLAFINTSSVKLITGGWESWYNRYSNINQKYIQDDLGSLGTSENLIKKYFLEENKPTIFQIDDGWEQGVGQWEPDRKRFPAGLNALATTISMQGYIPGLWIAPFVIDWRTDFCTMHTQWILRNEYGTPIEAGFNLSWGSVFGQLQPGLPFSFYCLDLSNEDVIEYLDSLMDRVINEWGFRYIKLDFLYAGMLQGKFVNGGTAYQWYNSALRILTSRKTNVKGQHVMYLGCGMPFESSFNYLPLSRIGPDTKEDWDLMLMKRLHFSGRTGAVVNLQSTLGHAFWDQSIFINDPDVIFLRDTNITLTNNEKELIALVNFLFGGQLMISDDMNETPTPLTRHIVELYKKFADETFGLVNMTSTTYVIFSKSGTYCGIINLSDKDIALNKNDFLKIISIQRGTKVTQESVNASLTPIVQHGAISADYIGVEKHSITILGGQNGR